MIFSGERCRPLVLAFFIGLTGCGGSNTSQTQATPSNPFAQAAAQETAHGGGSTLTTSSAHPQGDPFKAFVQAQGPLK